VIAARYIFIIKEYMFTGKCWKMKEKKIKEGRGKEEVWGRGRTDVWRSLSCSGSGHLFCLSQGHI
jgi:hypothetical protein